MAKANVLDFLYRKTSSPLEFNFDMLTAPPLLSLLTVQDIANLNSIARSVKLAGKIEEKYKLIDSIMTSRGFIKLHAGTNRVVYRFIEDQRFVAKIAVDRVGLGDNPAEFNNQFLLKPFVTKVFEVSPCGTVGLFERVDPIMSREEFASVADDIFNLLTKFFIGKYVLEDVGCHYFLNWGIRRNGYGLVLLDFPYLYELDGNKLYCNASPIPGRRDIKCGGELDYDDGFNNLVCTKCGKHYHARDLKKNEKDQLIIVGGKKTMKVKVKVGNEVILDSTNRKIAKVIDPEPETIKTKMSVRVDKPREAIFIKKEEAIQEKFDLDTVEKAVEEAPVEEFVDEVQELCDFVKDNPELDPENTEESTTLDDMVEELEEALETEPEYSEDEYDDDDDAEDYDQYLSNRDRTDIRRINKQNRRSSDFSDF